MYLFRTKSREEKIVDYLVGVGLLSNVPHSDVPFYRLAGTCAASSWPTKPCTRTEPISERQLNICDHQQSPTTSSQIVDVWSQQSVECSDRQEEGLGNDALDKIFVPRPALPVPLFQETFRKWKSSMDMQLRFRRLRKLRTAIVLQPLDEFPEFLNNFQIQLSDYEHVGFFELLGKFMQVFLPGVNVHLKSAISTSDWTARSRLHKLTGKLQLLADQMNQQLASFCLPSDAFAVVGVTWTDLFPSEKQDFVLGDTSAERHSAIISFGRFEIDRSNKEAQFSDICRVDGDLIWKMLKVTAHETCHLFYMSHCVFFECLMNESSSVAEAMSQPLYLCPVCMRKLQKVLKFQSVVEYEKNMLHFLRQLPDASLANQRLTNTIAWLERIITVIDTEGIVD